MKRRYKRRPRAIVTKWVARLGSDTHDVIPIEVVEPVKGTETILYKLAHSRKYIYREAPLHRIFDTELGAREFLAQHLQGHKEMLTAEMATLASRMIENARLTILARKAAKARAERDAFAPDPVQLERFPREP